MSRKLDRSILKKKYEKFCRAWQDEKTYQRVMAAAGSKLPDGMETLGRKPTFKMWLRAYETQMAAALQVPPEKAVEVEDPSWEE